MQLAVLPVVLVVLCAAFALVETLVAKMRVLLVPRLLAAGTIAALLGIASWLVELVMSGAVIWTLVALGLAVLVVRRRSLAVALVTAQALVLVGFALDEAESSGDVIAAGALAVRAVVLAGLFLAARLAHPSGATGTGARGTAGARRASPSPLRWL